MALDMAAGRCRVSSGTPFMVARGWDPWAFLLRRGRRASRGSLGFGALVSGLPTKGGSLLLECDVSIRHSAGQAVLSPVLLRVETKTHGRSVAQI